MDPSTSEEWLQVGCDRLADARAIADENEGSVGAAYLSGYGVECALKAVVCAGGDRVPREHNLVNLIRLSGLRLNGLKHDSWFVRQWAVDWRYLRESAQLPQSRSSSECVDAAGRLHGYLSKRLNRKKQRTASRRRHRL